MCSKTLMSSKNSSKVLLIKRKQFTYDYKKRYELMETD